MSVKSEIATIADKLYGYTFEYDEQKMFNISADYLAFPIIFYQETRQGKFSMKYQITNSEQVILYFMDKIELDGTIEDRETKRDSLIENAILPFIKLITESNVFENITDFNYDKSVPSMTDANEVSIELSFTAVLNATKCLKSIIVPTEPTENVQE